MTSEAQDAALATLSSSVASESTLIATFYSRRDAKQTRALHAHLFRALAHVSQATAVPTDWPDSDGDTFLHSFNPSAPSAHDTTVIQLALNESGVAIDAWRTLRHRLEHIVDATVLEGIWGYTLIYQAVLAPNVGADLALRQLLPAIQRLHLSEAMQPLAQADMAGGWVWLLAIPLHGESVAAANVYVALSSSEQQDRLVQEILYGPGAALLMPDLIAHKGYHQMRQYRLGDVQQRYEQSVAALQQTTDRVLDDLEQWNRDTDDLAALDRTYDRLTRVVPSLNQLRISLLQQVHNYDSYRGQIDANSIIEFHRSHLQTGVVDLELLVAQGRDVLEGAGTTLSMVQVQTEKAQERRQRQIQMLVAVVGVVLAVPRLIDRDVTSAFLHLLGLSMPKGGYHILLLFCIQVGITVVLAMLVVLAVKLMNSQPRGRSRSGRP